MRYRVQAAQMADAANGKWPEVEIPDNAVGLTVKFDFGVWYFGWLEPLDQPVAQNQQLPKAKLAEAFEAGHDHAGSDRYRPGDDFETWFAETYPEGVGVLPGTK